MSQDQKIVEEAHQKTPKQSASKAAAAQDKPSSDHWQATWQLGMMPHARLFDVCRCDLCCDLRFDLRGVAMRDLIQIKPAVPPRQSLSVHPCGRGSTVVLSSVVLSSMLLSSHLVHAAPSVEPVLAPSTPVATPVTESLATPLPDIQPASLTEADPAAAEQAADLPPLIDLSFPDLEASLPPLEEVELEQPVPSAEQDSSSTPRTGVFKRIRQWLRSDGSEGFAAEPVIRATVSFVASLPKSSSLEGLDQWVDQPTEDLKPLPQAAALAPLTAEQREAALNLLEENLAASLARVTVEEFTDFNDSLPRLRGLARDAAQAIGFYDSQFFFSKTAADQLQVDVVAGEPVRVTSQDIKIDGQAQEQRRFQRIESQPDLAVGDVLNHAKYEQTKSRIASAALERGYFDGQWHAHDVQVTLPDHVADIRLIYQSGQRYQFGEIEFGTTVEGAALPVRRALLEALVPFQAGDDYDARDVQTLSRQLLDTRWFNNIEVTAFTPDTIKNQQASPATPLVVPATEAPVNDASGAATTSAATTLAQPSPDPLTAAMPASSNTELNRAARAKVVPVRVLVDARQPNSAEAGIGYGTDTGVRFRSQYRRALVNDRGHSLDANLELSQIRQAIDARYSLPYKHPLRDTLSVFGGFEREEVEQLETDFNIESIGGTLGIERSIRPSPDDWQRTLSLRYRIDQVDVRFDEPELARLIDPASMGNTISLTQQVLLAGYALNKVTSRGGVDPYQGRRQLYQIEIGSQALLSDVDLAILRAGWRAIESFTESRKHQVVGRLDLATIVTDDFESVPYNLRFFAGGDQSIRGYDYKSLSTVRDGELSGGQNLAVASLEYNYRFLPLWRGAVFVDAGNAFDEQFSDDVKVGAGLGVRWSSPIGPIRIDVAAGLSETSVPIRLHFFIGPSL